LLFAGLLGETDVFELMSDADIVRMVSTVGNEADSDEDEADDFQPCTITVEHALEHAKALSEFSMSRPDLFGAQQVNAFLDAQRSLAQVLSGGKRQTSLLGFFAQR
jgi:hypothetical protein